MAYSGTQVAAGRGQGVVVATGMETELGMISELVAQAGEEATPLERRLDQLGHRLIWVTLAVTVLVTVTVVDAPTARSPIFVLNAGAMSLSVTVILVKVTLPVFFTLKA